MDAPSSHQPTPAKTIVETKLDDFLTAREPPKTFCPSEVARGLSRQQLLALGYETWRDAMPGVRELAWEKRSSGELEILQKGAILDDSVKSLDDVRGPIRLRRK
ncbi:hypothetical protein KC340_g5105 [Hortaea werneckii]|nr:hypothetical protein KC342_g5419 [Hortaea werneckii]KAI7100730.1 hypothetical protein KC339_g7280 [Hortaea werneckii]KAI7242707.1 hypothetical protein KC365_g2919 [Hortaea werneckii]KAI7328456.1 hypothetical protein KC340_g5105 [Hortaea werneckii]KAI7390449.1 hypothetical protein KC328_g7939 [Hortaea werneckii]